MYVGKYGVQTDNNGLLYMRARYYNTDIKRFVNVDPIRAGLNWYGYCENDPVNQIDPEGLDSYIYYDPYAIPDYTAGYISAWRKDLAIKFYNGDISKVHLIPLENRNGQTSAQIFEREWNKMANDSSIDVILLHGHGNKDNQYIELASNLILTASDNRSVSKNGVDTININNLKQITTDYLILASCHQGNSDLDYNGSNIGWTNFASDLLLSKNHIINKAVIAPDDIMRTAFADPHWVGALDAGFRSFKLNPTTRNIDSFVIGSEFPTMSRLIDAQQMKQMKQWSINKKLFEEKVPKSEMKKMLREQPKIIFL